jgi:type II secretory pathway component GspD/PulD (secretin)
MDRLQRWVLIVAWAAAGSFVTRLSADDAPAAQSSPSVRAEPVVGAGPAVFTPAGVNPGTANQPATGPGKPEAGKGKPEGEKKPGDGKEKGEGKSEELPPIQRPAKPPKPPDPKELKVRPGKDGTVSFNFRGQPWPAVLEWLADISGMSLDWQELPGDYINLATQRSYTVKEARDLVNRHLLVRGYTLLIQGEVLSVVNIKKLNPALVPRIEPEELARRDAHEFVRVSFPLDWMLAESAAEELKPYLSPNGKMTPLRATNRLEVMDTVSNLRDVDRLVKAEQSSQGQERLVHEFVIRHAKAADVAEQLRGLIGGELKHPGERGGKNAPQDNPMDEARRMQMMAMGQMQMQQPQPGQPGGQPQPGPQKSGKDVNLVVNPRNNSILVVAPPDKMAIAVQAVKILDVARDEDEPMMTAVTRTQVYRLASLDPETLVKALDEIGHLSPTTQFQVDKKNHLVVVTGPLADQMVIRSLVQKLDGSERKFKVIPLRRLEADYVAGTVEIMMVGEKPKEQNRRSYYYGFDPFGGQREKPEEATNRFRVEADVEHNRLLLFANPIELQEVENLLVQLGEIPAESGNRATARVIELPPGTEADEFLDQVRRKWSVVEPNRLILPPAEKPLEKPEKLSAPPAVKSGLDGEHSPERKVPPGEKTPPSPAPARVTAWAPREAYGPCEGDTGGQSASGTAVVSAGWRLVSDSPSTKTNDQPVPVPQAACVPCGNDTGGQAAGGTPEPIVRKAPPGRQEARDPAAAAPHGPASPDSPPGPPPPITITRGPNGQLLLSSPDTEALDRLEELIGRSAAPSPNDYKIFKLRYAWAYGVASILKDVFKDDDAKDKRRTPWWWDDYSQDDKSDKDKVKLSKRRPLKIISDSDTNSVLVQGADASQLKRIDELVKFYDKPEPTDAQSVRKCETFKLRYSQAKVVAETVKDVYRDLLSANDKALTANQPQQQQPQRSFGWSMFGDDGNEDKDKGQKVPKFKGLLSIGVDEVSNTIVISAPAYLMQVISKMVQDLDEAAAPVQDTMAVVRIGSGVSTTQIEESLSRVLGQGEKRSRTPRQPQAKPGEHGWRGPGSEHAHNGQSGVSAPR